MKILIEDTDSVLDSANLLDLHLLLVLEDSL